MSSRTTARIHPPAALTIAGSDPSGGAGIQGDLKTFTALGAYGTAVITALTAQATTGVSGVHEVPADFVAEQIHTLLGDVRIDAVKIGMLATAEFIGAVASALAPYPKVPIVLDPVMVSTSGSRLLDDDATTALRDFLPRVSLVTPNIPEAAALTGTSPALDLPGRRAQAAQLQQLGAARVLITGGHAKQANAEDLWREGEEEQLLVSAWVDSKNTHGSGCALSSAIAALCPRAPSLLEAAREAKQWLHGAVSHADELRIGHGPGPVHHCHGLW